MKLLNLPRLFLKKIKQLCTLHRIDKVFVESNAFQKVLMYVNEFQGLPMVPSATVTDKQKRFISFYAKQVKPRIKVPSDNIARVRIDLNPRYAIDSSQQMFFRQSQALALANIAAGQDAAMANISTGMQGADYAARQQVIGMQNSYNQ